MMKRLIIVRVIGTAILLLSTALLRAQDIHFSQFYETSILRNPGLTGLFTGDYKVAMIYRNQWSSISKPYQTGLVNAETRIPINEVGDFLSVGLLGYYDKAGSVSLQTISFYPALNYNKSLEDGQHSYLSAGFTGGYIQRNFDPTKMTVDNQYQGGYYNASAPTGENTLNPKFSYWDLGFGVCFNSSAGSEEEENRLNYVIGVSGYHVTQPRNSFFDNNSIKLGMRFNFNAAASKQMNESFSFQLHGNYMRQGDYNETILGGLLGWHSKDATGAMNFVLFGGLFYRVGDAFIPTVKLRYKDLAFTCSYDFNTSKLKAATNLRGGYEISVIKTGLINNPEHQKSRTICPEFY
ncbi:MAG: PorP/SprF family type IX secretion system membrane protein [Bacteroidetes bacterium]|nr:PorP/SprF family type IX secretion system membrane protein [Bacteroidota bacterium]